jgi:hypothetical protein
VNGADFNVGAAAAAAVQVNAIGPREQLVKLCERWKACGFWPVHVLAIDPNGARGQPRLLPPASLSTGKSAGEEGREGVSQV